MARFHLISVLVLLTTSVGADEVDQWAAQLQSPKYNEYLQARGELRDLVLFGDGTTSKRARNAIARNDQFAREWQAIYGVWKGRSLRLNLREDFAIDELHYLFSRAHVLTQLQIVGGKLNDRQVTLLCELPVLRGLKLESCKIKSDAPWRLPAAASIELVDCRFAALARIRANKATRLLFSKCAFGPNVELATPELNHLSFHSCRFPPTARMQLSLPKLKTLDFSKSIISSRNIQSLKAPQLVKLNIVDMDFLIDDLVEIKRFPKLDDLQYGAELLPNRVLRALDLIENNQPFPREKTDVFEMDDHELGSSTKHRADIPNPEFQHADVSDNHQVDEFGYTIFPGIDVPNN